MANWTTYHFGQLDDTEMLPVNLIVNLFLSPLTHTHTRRRMLSSRVFGIVPSTHPHAPPTPTAAKKKPKKKRTRMKNERRMSFV